MDIFNKVVDYEVVKKLFFDEMKLLYSGFGGVGTPPSLIDCLIESGVKEVNLIGNDAGFPWIGIGKFIVLKRAKSLIASHIGSNPIAGELMHEGKLKVEFSPQGILNERIRAGGVGLNGILTDVGKGTILAENKTVVKIDNKEFLFESPLTGDVGIVHAAKADTFGNLTFNKTARNNNPIIAMAGKTTIVEADEIVAMGQLDPEEVVVPGIYVNYLVPSGGINWKWIWEIPDKRSQKEHPLK